MFWGRFYEACNLRGLKPNNVTKALGLSSATATKWKNGSDPKADALIKIADYLDVSVDYLLGRSDDPNKKNVCPISRGRRIGVDTFGVMPYLKGFYGLYCNRITHFLTHHASRAAHLRDDLRVKKADHAVLHLIHRDHAVYLL